MLLNLSLLHKVSRFMLSYYVYDSVETHQNGKKGILEHQPKLQ
jgi:hypothetical protein